MTLLNKFSPIQNVYFHSGFDSFDSFESIFLDILANRIDVQGVLDIVNNVRVETCSFWVDFNADLQPVWGIKIMLFLPQGWRFPKLKDL